MTQRRRVAAVILRWTFLAAVLAFAVIGLWRDWPRIVEAVASVPAWRLPVGMLLFSLGTVATLPVWWGLLAAIGHPLPRVPASRILLVGQLGKYIPGSVWSVGAQAGMAQGWAVPVRRTLAASTFYILYHAAGAASVGAVALASGWIVLPPAIPIDASVARVLGLTIAIAIVAVTVPPVSARVLAALSGGRAVIRWRQFFLAFVLAAVTWLLWGLGAAFVTPLDEAGIAEVLMSIIGAYAVAYLAGLVVVFAPAGVGVREAVLVLMLQASIGLAGSVAVALITRLIGILSDLGLALVAHLADRGARNSEPEGELPSR